MTPGTGLSIHADGLGNLGAQAGNYLLNVNPNAPTDTGSVTISGYCIEPILSTSSFTQYQVVPITHALDAIWGPNAYVGFAAAAWIVNQGYTGSAAVAAQAAVWELTWDYVQGTIYNINNAPSGSGGNFYLTDSTQLTTYGAAILADYTNAIAAVNGGWLPTGYDLYQNPLNETVWSGFQDYVGPAVPIPPSALLLGTGLLGLVGFGWRRRSMKG